MAVKKQQDNTVDLKQLLLKTITIGLVGTSPLIMHAWSKKAKEQMLSKQMKLATTGKEAKDPQRDFEESIYTDDSGLPAFPSAALKSAAVDAAIAMDFKKTNLRQAFHIEGEMVPIVGSDPTPREDMVRIGMGKADIRYRAEFKQWGTMFNCTLNTALLSIEQTVNLFNAAGFGIGIGEWRPQRDGQSGRFRVADESELKWIGDLCAKRNKRARAA